MLKNPNDQAMVTRVGDLLRKLAADPANGVASILDRQQIAAMGGASQASFIVDMKPGWAVGGALEGPIARDRATRGGTHGYAPTHPELRASFFIAGEGIPAGVDTRCDSSVTVTVLFTSPPKNPVTAMPRAPYSFSST